MAEILLYLIKSGLCMAFFWILYRLLLAGETFFKLNRVYLLGSLGISLVIPLVAFLPAKASGTLFAELPELVLPLQNWIQGSAEGSSAVGLPAGIVLLVFISLVFLCLSVWGLLRLLRWRQQGRLVYAGPLKVVLLAPQSSAIDPGRLTGFTFLHTIFMDPQSFAGPDREKILAHEAVHARQLHSIDLLLCELMKPFFWWNPFFWLSLRSLKETHEFLADEGVLSQGYSRLPYQQMLVNTALGFSLLSPVNALGYSSLKKRVKMMNKNKSNPIARLKMFAVLPILIGMMLAFAPLNGQPHLGEGGDQEPQFKGGFKALVSFIQKELKYPEEAKTAKITGKVMVRIKLDKKGKVKGAEVIEGIGYGCDDEAVRVVKAMPDWEPGYQEGKAVGAEVILPFNFSLPKE